MNKVIWVFLISVTIVGCGKKARYERLVERELTSGVRYDSLFFGIYLGMTSKDFYTHCWELNKKGLIRQGSSNLSVVYDLKDMKHAAKMNFYPTFLEDKIYEMPVRFQYDAWAPWNKHLQSDSLQLDVLNLLEGWYGEDFMEVKHPVHGSAFVKVDGNRRISIFTQGPAEVFAVFTDMSMDELADEKRIISKDEQTVND
jgi:hypothetical protein